MSTPNTFAFNNISAYAPNLAESTLALNVDIDFILRILSSMSFHILGNRCSWHETSVCGTIIIVDNMIMQDLSDGYIWQISWCNICRRIKCFVKFTNITHGYRSIMYDQTIS